jgi:hypothetical protein
MSLLWWACVGLVLIVNYLASASMLISGGLFVALRPKLVGAVFAVGFIYFLLSVWDVKHGWLPRAFWEAHAWAISAALIAASFLAWHKALHMRCLQRPHLFASLLIWIAYVSAVIALCLRVIPTNMSIPPSAIALGLASLALPLIAIAVAPLTLAAHRHQ